MQIQRNHVLLGLGAAIILIGVWLLPIDVTPEKDYNGKLFASSSWQVAVSGQGHLQSLLSDRSAGVVGRYALQSVERGEASDFVLAYGLRAGSPVQAGDTVGTLQETGWDQRRAALLSDITVASREQAAVEAGQKESLIEEAQVRLERKQALITLQERIVSRTRQLHTRALVSDEELDSAEADLTMLVGDADVIRAELAVLQSGDRSVDVDLARSRVDAARRQLEALNRRTARSAIVTPITGVVTRSLTDSVLVSVTDTSNWIVIVPISLTDRQELVVGDSVAVAFPVTQARAAGRLISVDPRIQHVGVIPVLLGIVSLQQAPPESIEGLPVRVFVTDSPVRLRHYLADRLSEWVPWQNWFGNAERV